MAATRTTATIRWMIRSDVEQVKAIEQTVGENHWSESTLFKHLKDQIGVVCVADRRVLGYMIYELHPHHFRIVNLTVAQKYWRKSIGRHFIERLKSRLSPGRRQFIEFTLREGNLQGQLFLKAMGFECDEIISAYFGDELQPDDIEWENGYHFVYNAP